MFSYQNIIKLNVDIPYIVDTDFPYIAAVSNAFGAFRQVKLIKTVETQTLTAMKMEIEKMPSSTI